LFVATGGLVTDNWQEFAWPKIRYLQKSFGLQPWYSDTNAFLMSVAAQQQDAVKARAAADAAAAEEAAAAAAAAAANPALNLTTITETVVPVKAADEDDSSSGSGSRVGSKAAAQAAGNSAPAAVGKTQLPSVQPTAKPAASIAGGPTTQTALPTQQEGAADASYVHFDVQPPPAIVAGGTAGAAVGNSKPDAAAAASTSMGRSTKILSQAVKAAAPAQLVDTHANLPAVFGIDDVGDRSESALQLEVPATVEEEQLSVPATVEEVPV
jgi:hypothetical protein